MARGVSVLIAIAIALGGVAGVTVLTGWTPGAGEPVQEASADVVADPAETIAHGMAVQVGRAWASATRSQPGMLLDLVPGLAAGDLPEQVDRVEDVVVTESSRERETWAVTVAVTGRPDPTEEEPDPAPHLRYLRIPILVDDAAARVVGLPAIVPAPEPAEQPRLAYTAELTTVDAIAAAAEGFMTSLLLGNGDVARYTTPGTEITPVTPAPYADLTVSSVMAIPTDVDPAEVTSGEQVEVLVTVAATAGSGTDRLNYPLLLTARDGRWEVTTIRSSPLLETSESELPTEGEDHG